MDDQQTTPEPNSPDSLPSENQPNDDLPSISPEPAAPEVVSPSSEPVAETAPTVAPAETIVTPSTPAESSTSTAPETPLTTPAVSTTPAPQTAKKSKRGLLLVLVVVILAAAGYAAYHFTKSTTTKTATTTTATKKDVALIRLGIGFPEPTAFYPAVGDNDDTGSVIDINHQMFEGLTGYQNGTKVVPLLAKSWTNPDLNTWVFALQHGVKFHDGTLMTATQVADSINQVLPTDYGQEFADTIKSVTVVDPYTVKITTTSPDSLLPNKLTFLDIFDTSNTAKVDDPVTGTGPYIIKPGTTPTAAATDLVAYPDYWGGHVYTRELDVTAYNTDDEMNAAFSKNQVDIVGNLDQTQVVKLNTTVYKTFDIPGALVSQLVPNTLHGGPLANAKVRNALWLALDPVAIAKAHSYLGTPVSQIVPPQIPGYDPALTRPPTDAAAAKQQIIAAGYPNGFSFSLSYFSPAADDLANEVKKELASAGVTVILDPETDGNALVAKVSTGKTDMYYNSEASDLLDGSDIMFLFDQSPDYDNPKLDALYTQASQTFDPAKRLALLQQMSDIVYTDKATLPLYIATLRWAEAKNLNLHLTYQEISGSPGINFSQVYSN